VFGYTIMNDVSERGLNSTVKDRRQREMDRFLDWLAGKWFDTFAPCGPWIVTEDEIGDPHRLEINLTINDKLRQHGNTSDMLFRITEQIAYASSIMTLEPGDIISTGTPAGAGIGGAAGRVLIGVKAVDADNRARFLPARILDYQSDWVWLADLPAALTLITVGQEFVADGQEVRPVEEDSIPAAGAKAPGA